MDQSPDQQTIAYIVGGIVAAITAVVATVKRTKARLSTGAKVDDLSAQMRDDFKELHETFRHYAQDNARLVNETKLALKELQGDVKANTNRLEDHRQRIGRLEERISR